MGRSRRHRSGDIRVLEKAVEDGVRYMQAQGDNLIEIRGRSMQLLQVILVAESIAFSVVLARGVTISPWAVGMLLGALAATLWVTVYISHPIPDWEIPGEMALGIKAYRDGIALEDHLEKLLEEMDRGTKHNTAVIEKRFRAFERLLYALVALFFAAVITFLATP
ncbi:hypothetical protein AB0C70_38275 [Streptomyces sp. NPDC048564]|uniref:hypothetical protein n=1 Tax=Streptomyces sp. NPDC048564 TaxID=3155760 RepID=UPI00342F6083